MVFHDPGCFRHLLTKLYNTPTAKYAIELTHVAHASPNPVRHNIVLTRGVHDEAPYQSAKCIWTSNQSTASSTDTHTGPINHRAVCECTPQHPEPTRDHSLSLCVHQQVCHALQHLQEGLRPQPAVLAGGLHLVSSGPGWVGRLGPSVPRERRTSGPPSDGMGASRSRVANS